jgi:hypothetical protein
MSDPTTADAMSPDAYTHEGSGIHCQHRHPIDISQLKDGGLRRHLLCECGADWFVPATQAAPDA